MAFRIFKWAVYTGFALMVCVAVGVVVLFYSIAPTIPQLPDRLDDLFGQATEIYASDPEGNPLLIHTIGGHQRIPLEEIPQAFKHAVIATEDAGFYEHDGVDKRGMIRALIANIRHGRLEEGASTITQQLVRHLFFTREKKWIRKLREMMTAMQIETRFDKDEILAAYCNNMFFGSDAYGIEEAAQRFFSKHARDLTLGEAALLAGLLQAPSRYNPYYHMDRALARRSVVLSRMADRHFITEERARRAEEEPVELRGAVFGPSKGPFFVDYVRDILIDRYGHDTVYYGGLKVYTTMDIRLQEIAEQAVRQKLAELDAAVGDSVYETASTAQKRRALQCALVAIETRTGRVRAIVGGREYTSSEYNRAVQSNRQPGSGFKPVIYLAAVDRLGYAPNTVVVDDSVSFTTDLGEEWKPKNFSRYYRGPVILKWALMNSINVISAKLNYEVGPSTVVEYARRLGITSPLKPYLSLALGTYGVSPLEMAGAYAVFANGGVYYKPHVIYRVEDSEGNVLDETVPEGRRVVSAQSAYLMLDMLRGVVLRGTGASIPVRYGFTMPAGGKTGTSSDSKDVWFNGFTRDLTTTVWVGYDDNRPLPPLIDPNAGERETTGASGAIPIWATFMKNATEELRRREAAAHPEAAEARNTQKRRSTVNPGEMDEEHPKNPFDFPVPLGIEFTQVDIRTGGPPVVPDSTLTVAIRGATPKAKPATPEAGGS